jgi:glutaminyl-tRNA synthetase
MPPKAKSAPSDAETSVLVELFQSIGLTQSKASDVAKSPKIAEPLKSLIERSELSGRPLEEKQAGLLVSYAPLSGKLRDDEERRCIVDRILDGKLKSVDQITGEYLLNRCLFF